MHIMICRKSAVQLQLTLSGDPDLDGLLMLEAPPVGGCGVPPGDVLLLPGAWNPGCKKPMAWATYCNLQSPTCPTRHNVILQLRSYFLATCRYKL